MALGLLFQNKCHSWFCVLCWSVWLSIRFPLINFPPAPSPSPSPPFSLLITHYVLRPAPASLAVLLVTPERGKYRKCQWRVSSHLVQQFTVPLLSHELLVFICRKSVPVRKLKMFDKFPVLTSSDLINYHLISILVNFTLCCKWVSLLVIQILLQIEESIKKDRRHLASFQVF